MAPGEEDFWAALPSVPMRPAKARTALALAERFQRMRRVNEARIEWFRRRLGDRERDVFDILPLLLHSALPGAPGGVESSMPATGIFNFNLTEVTNAAAGRLFPRAGRRSWASLHRPAIRSLLCVGRSGAHGAMCPDTTDFWLILDERTASGSIRAALEARLSEISIWAARRDLPVRFVALTAAQVQGAMRIDEFYRAHFVLQGQLPLWWLAEPFCDDEEYEVLGSLVECELGQSADTFVDLGRPRPASRDEAMAASLRILAAELVNPADALVELAILDRWNLAEAGPLCEACKQRLLASAEPGPLEVDPQILLVWALAEEAERLAIPGRNRTLQQAFFLHLNSKPQRPLGGLEVRRTWQLLTEHWGWDTSEFLRMERYSSWDAVTLDQQGRYFQTYLEEIFDALAEARPDLEPNCQALLRAKVTSARCPATDQVKLLATGYFPGRLEQDCLKFERTPQGWSLRVGEQQLCFRSGTRGIDGLLAFAVANRLVGPTSSIQLEGRRGPALSAVEARLMRMAQAFGETRPEDIAIGAFAQPACPQRCLVEVSVTPREPLGARGTLEVFEQWDLLDYGTQASCQIERILTWTVDSQGAIRQAEFTGGSGVIELVVELHNCFSSQAPQHVRFEPEGIGSEDRSGAQRLEGLFKTIGETFGRDRGFSDKAVLTRVAGDFHLLMPREGSLVAQGPLATAELSEALASLGVDARRLVPDRKSTHLAHLVAVLELVLPEQEQVFVYPDCPSLGLVAVDARGALWVGGGATTELLWELCSLSLPAQAGPRILRLHASPDGKWETSRIEFSPTPADIWVEGDLADHAGLGFRVRGLAGRRAESFEEAAIWLLSRWGVGLERTPRLALGELLDGGRALEWIQRLRLRQEYARLLDQAFRDQLARVHSGRKNNR